MSRVTRRRVEAARGGEWGALAAWIIGAEAVGGLGTLLARPGAWYAGLDKPSTAPATGVLTLGWSACYLLLAVAIWLTWRERARVTIRRELAAAGAMMGLSVLWTISLFGARRPDLAGLASAACWILAIVLLRRLGGIRRLAAAAFVPVFCWVSYLGAVTIGIWLRNG